MHYDMGGGGGGAKCPPTKLNELEIALLGPANLSYFAGPSNERGVLSKSKSILLQKMALRLNVLIYIHAKYCDFTVKYTWYSLDFIQCIFGCACLNNYVLNLLWPSDAIWHRRCWSTLALMMACHQTGDRPLPEPMLILLSIASLETNFR